MVSTTKVGVHENRERWSLSYWAGGHRYGPERWREKERGGMGGEGEKSHVDRDCEEEGLQLECE